MDHSTDIRIQNVLRIEFQTSTIFTIARRLETIVGYDRLLVMSAGEIVEAGTPRHIFDKKGAFWGMVHGTGEVDKLLRLMK